MWRIRPPHTSGDRLWRFVADLRRGDDHDPEEEFRALLPTARLVSEALKGGGTGPEHHSEMRLMEAIARSEERGRAVARRRSWAVPAFAATGWVLASVGFTFSAYQIGLSHGVDANRVAVMPPITAPVVIPTPPEPEAKPVSLEPKKPKAAKPVKKVEPKKPLPEMPPPVRGDQIVVIPDDNVLFPRLASQGEENTPQNELIREGQTYLAQGKWEDAIDSLQKAADENPSGESALDALHLSARIAQDSLRDPKRASEIYRKEAEMARQMIQTLAARNDAAPENVKMRLARALTSTGLLERDPKMIQQAADEVQPENRGAETGP